MQDRNERDRSPPLRFEETRKGEMSEHREDRGGNYPLRPQRGHLPLKGEEHIGICRLMALTVRKSARLAWKRSQI